MHSDSRNKAHGNRLKARGAGPKKTRNITYVDYAGNCPEGFNGKKRSNQKTLRKQMVLGPHGIAHAQKAIGTNRRNQQIHYICRLWGPPPGRALDTTILKYDQGSSMRCHFWNKDSPLQVLRTFLVPCMTEIPACFVLFFFWCIRMRRITYNSSVWWKIARESAGRLET